MNCSGNEDLKQLKGELDQDLGETLLSLKEKVKNAGKNADVGITPDECASIVRGILAA
jgi:hypothetical protein